MTVDAWTLAAILGMAIATYATRAGGYVLFRAMRPPPFLREALRYIPGALFVSYVAPALFDGGLQQWVGAAATAVLMVATGQLAVAIIGGIAAAWAVWLIG